MYLVLDASANGRPRSYKASLDDTSAWPNLMHLSWILLDKDLKPIEDYNILIKAESYTPTEAALKSHHIDPEKIRESPDTLKDTLEKFSESVMKSDYIFAHNLQYNEGVIGSEYYRVSMSSPLISAEKFCLMHEATYFCKLPGKRGYKWPSLQEMHSLMFKQGFSPSGHARADVIAASRCFIYLMKSGALEDLFDE
ncbi:MAG: DNA polymerase-3 subunit epsilon [Saprospiraceae bacterium]|jgi:DNA polymerase-3 subunit epsilon